MRIGNCSWGWVLLSVLFCGAGVGRVCAQTPAAAETLQRIREIHELQQALVQSADITVRYVIVIHEKTSGDLQERLRKYTASAPSRHVAEVSPALTEILTDSGLEAGKSLFWRTLRIRFDGPATDNEIRDDRGQLLRRTTFDGKKSAFYRADSQQVDLQDGPGRVLRTQSTTERPVWCLPRRPVCRREFWTRMATHANAGNIVRRSCAARTSSGSRTRTMGT